MILAHGKIYEDKELKTIMASLQEDCLHTLADMNKKVTAEMVMNACETLSNKVLSGEYDHVVKPLLEMVNISKERFVSIASMFKKETIEKKLRFELGNDYNHLESLTENIQRRYEPLGILFHIAAGNVDGLPAYSVMEGLLAGNLNILKLPSADNGVSILLLHELIKIEPRIAEFIYVFDVPSTDVESLKFFASIADGVVVWGGDFAVKAAREMATPSTKIIAWGHKLSFAYATLNAKDSQLKDLAKHICETNQVLCSSCQGIFVDTEDDYELEKFAKRFFDVFVKTNKEYPSVPVGMRAKMTLQLYNDSLEKNQTKKVLHQDGVSVSIMDDSTLQLSYMFRNCWIKKLPRNQIVASLKYQKGYLQTAALICEESEFENLSAYLARCGVVRVCEADSMSRALPGEAHDGEYALRAYSRIVEIG